MTVKKDESNAISRRKYLKYVGAGAVVVAAAAGGAYYYSTMPPTPMPTATTSMPTATTSMPTATTSMPTATTSMPTATTSAMPNVNIDIWSQSGPMFEFQKHAGETYNALHPNVTFTNEQNDDATCLATYNTRLSTAPPPDIAFNWVGPAHTYPLAEAGLLLELDDAIVKYGWDDPKKFNQGYKQYAWKGHYYVMSHDYVTYPNIYYNPGIFDKVGVAEPKTTQEFYDLCAKVRAAGYNSVTFGIGSVPGWASNICTFFLANIMEPSRLKDFFNAYGYYLTDPSFKDRTVKMTDPEFVKTFQVLKDYTDKVYAKGYVAMSDDDAVGLFASGKAAMYQAGSWGPGVLDPVVKDFDYNTFVPPTDFGTVSPPWLASIDNSFVISSHTKYPDVVLDFYDHMIGVDEQLWIMNVHGIFTNRTDIDPSLITNKHLVECLAWWDKFGRRTVNGLSSMIHSSLSPSPFIDTLTALMSGQVTPEQAASKLEAAAVKINQAGS